MAEFRILPQRHFVNEEVRKLSLEEEKILLYCKLGMQACSQTEVGIYPIMRGEIAFGANLGIEKVEEALNNFNANHGHLLKYDTKNHIAFVVSFFADNRELLKTPESVAAAIRKDFKKTRDLCPQFWAEFTVLNENSLKGCQKKLNRDKNYDSNYRIFQKLFDLKDEFFKDVLEKPSTKILEVSVEKMKKDIENILS